MDKKTIIYRGYLKSCNYHCSYCPFCRRKPLATELERDKRDFIRFCDSIRKRMEEFSIGAVFVTPYGEASIHNWYWEGLAHLSGLHGIDRVGMQTNLSFPLGECLKRFDSAEGKREKLNLWATFHPEMTTVDAFALKCRQLTEGNVRMCAGAVGVPHNIPLLRQLREKLPETVYLWINKMDGLGRNYTADEIRDFMEIDPFFDYGLRDHAADVRACRDRCFVESDGKMRTCNISRVKEMNWYEGGVEEVFRPVCVAKRCSCYLAYSGRSDFKLKDLFGSYPAFRIPIFYGSPQVTNKTEENSLGMPQVTSKTRENSLGMSQVSGGWSAVSGLFGKPDKFRAVFFDLFGTLIAEHGRGLTKQVRESLGDLKKICPVFLATSMPAKEVWKRLRDDLDLFQGGVFASGAQLILKDKGDVREKIYPADMGDLSVITRFAEDVRARLMLYEKEGMIYKAAIAKSRHGVWTEAEGSRMAELLDKSDCRYFVEGNCLEIIHRNCNKGTGVEEMCGWLGIPMTDVLAVGNDREDLAMAKVCGAFLQL